MSPMSDSEVLSANRDATSQTHLTGDRLALLDDVKWRWGELPESSSAQLFSASSAEMQPSATSNDVLPTGNNGCSASSAVKEKEIVTLNTIIESSSQTVEDSASHVVEPCLMEPAPEAKKG